MDEQLAGDEGCRHEDTSIAETREYSSFDLVSHMKGDKVLSDACSRLVREAAARRWA